MSLTNLINRPCTITTGIETDDFGIDPDPATPAPVTTVCELQQRQRGENADDGEVSWTDWIAFFPVGTLIDTADTVTVDGHNYEVVGEPWVARNPATEADSHIEATLWRTAGAGDGS